MKKYTLTFIFVFLLFPLFAQPITKTISKENLQQEISLMFQREQNSYSKIKENARTQYLSQELTQLLSQTNQFTNPVGYVSQLEKKQKTPPSVNPGDMDDFPAWQVNGRRKIFPVKQAEYPWQIAMLISVDRRPIDETLHTLHWLVKQGYVRRATLVAIPEEASSAENGTLYFIYADSKAPVVEKIQFSLNITSEDLLHPMFKSMQTEDLYTGIIVNAHGSGMEIIYGEDGWMEPVELLQSLQKANLKADILDLESCHMASFYTAHQIARYQNVKYLIASSDFHYSSTQKMTYPLLKNLQYEPKTAAINTNRQMKQLFNFDRSYIVNNSLAIDLQPLYQPINNWFDSYGTLIINSKQELKDKLHKIFKPQLGEVRSLHKIVRQQMALLENKPLEELEEIFSNGECADWNELKENFVKNSQTLLESLNESLLAQWCYSQQKNTVYSDQIPPNIDCSDGISVTKKHLEKLFAANKNSFFRCDWNWGYR